MGVFQSNPHLLFYFLNLREACDVDDLDEALVRIYTHANHGFNGLSAYSFPE